MTNPAENKVIAFDDARLIREGEAAVDLYNQAQGVARKQIMPMALGLLAARRKYPANRDFGDWLHTSSYREMEHQDRAALIKIGEHADFAAKFVRTTSLISPQTIWDAIQDLMPSYYDSKTTEPGTKPAETPQTPPPTPAETTSPSSAKGDENSGDGPAVTKRHPFFGLARAEEVAAIYLSVDTRTLIGNAVHKHGGKEIWNIILRALDGGLLQPMKAKPSQLTLKVLFPDAPMSYTRNLLLTDRKDREKINNEILPAAIECRDRLLAAPDQIAVILREHAQKKHAEAQAKQQEEKVAVARASMPANQREVVLFNKRFWPLVEVNPVLAYDYEQLVAAAWFFDDAYRMARQTPDNSPKSCGIKIRHMMKWFSHYLSGAPDGLSRAAIRRVVQLIVEITRAMEAAPEAEQFNLRPEMPDLDKPYQD